MYVSITGLDLIAWYHWPKFVMYTIPAMQQAKVAPGIISTDSKRINGTIHTMSVWENRESMRQCKQCAAD